MAKVGAWWRTKVSKPTRDALRAAVTSAVWAFAGTFGAVLLTWLQSVTQWATDNGGTVVFPDPSVLVKALVAGAVAGFTFVAAAIVRIAQSKGWIPGNPPTYPTP